MVLTVGALPTFLFLWFSTARCPIALGWHSEAYADRSFWSHSRREGGTFSSRRVLFLWGIRSQASPVFTAAKRLRPPVNSGLRSTALKHTSFWTLDLLLIFLGLTPRLTCLPSCHTLVWEPQGTQVSHIHIIQLTMSYTASPSIH